MTDPNNDQSPRDDDSHTPEDVYQEIHEWESSESLSEAVTTAIADFEGVTPTDLEPLYEKIDPDALEALFAADQGGLRADGIVSFSLEDYGVSIHSHGEFAVISISEGCRSLPISGKDAVDDAPTFESALQDVIQTAAQNGVSVTGGWRVERPLMKFPDWEIVITELAERTDGTEHTEE